MSKGKISDFFTFSTASASKKSHEEVDLEVSEEISLTFEQTLATDDGSGSSAQQKKHVFQQSWLRDWPWLKTNDKGEMICTYCLNHGFNNTFSTGNSNFRTSTLSRHAESKDHKSALLAQSSSKSFKKTVENTISKKEEAVISAIETVYWLAKENIATVKYGSLLEFLDKQGCQGVKDLCSGKNATYRSTTIAQEIQQAISDTITADILSHLQEAMCLAVMADESTDISVTGKLIFYVRFVDKHFDVKSHFLGNFTISEKDASTITECIVSALEQRGVKPEKVICLGSDGASVMTGVRNGVAAKLKNLSPFLINIHCVAHRLALCTSQAAKKIDTLNQYKTVLTNLYYYFKSSSVRSGRLKKIQTILDLPEIKVSEMHDIRWFSFYKVLDGMYRSWTALITYFDSTELSKDPKSTGLRKSLLQYQFVAFTWMLMDIIPVVTTLNLVFQKESFDIGAIQTAVLSTISSLRYLKDTDGFYCTELKNLIQDGCLHGHKLQGSINIQSSKSTMHTFIDNLIENIQKRFPAESLSVVSAFSCVSMRDLSFSNDLNGYGVEKLEVLLDHYGKPKGDPIIEPLVNADTARQEFKLLKTLVLDMKYPRDQMKVLWKTIYHCHADLFPNMIVLARIGLTLPVQTAICERGFSVQNIIKNDRRNRLGDSQLRTLMTIAIEGPPFKDFNARTALEEFRSKKQRRIFNKIEMSELIKMSSKSDTDTD